MIMNQKKNMCLRVILGVVLCISMCFHVIAAPLSANQAVASELTPVQSHGQLSVNGTRITDQYGKPFQLRGISTHGINWDVGYPYVNKESFQTLRDDWGANAVRLAMYTAEYNGYCSGGNQGALKELVNNGVQYATELGMYAVIDWHVLNDRNPNQNIEQSKAFFQEMSAKYNNYNNVIYEICNEPNGGDVTWDVIKQYANTIIPIIRANDPDAIIIVGTPTWSQLGMQGHTNEVADSPLTGYSNIVYSLHFYCAEWAHTQYLPAKVDYAMSKGIPIIVSEFGLSQASGSGNIDTAQATAWLDKLEGYGIGYFCWSLSNKNETSALIQSGCSKTSGWSEGELTAAGQYIRGQYRARRETIQIPADPAKVDAFVVRLYELVLGRAPESAGREHWNTVLMNGSRSGASVGYGFVFSEEYKSKRTNDSDYVEMLYNVFLGRGSDPSGKAHWLGLLGQGLSREYIFRGFAESQEYTQICESYGIIRGNVVLTQARDQNPNLTGYVNRLYTQALGRNGEEDGLNHWCRTIQEKVKTPEQVAESFILSQEFNNKNLSNEEYVKVLYRTFMGREYDQAGFEHWMNEMKNGCSRENILHRFATSSEFKGIQAGFGL